MLGWQSLQSPCRGRVGPQPGARIGSPACPERVRPGGRAHVPHSAPSTVAPADGYYGATDPYPALERDAIAALGAKGILFVAASGNGAPPCSAAAVHARAARKPGSRRLRRTTGDWWPAKQPQAPARAHARHPNPAPPQADAVDISARKSYPAWFPLPNLISVAASDSSDRRACFSNFGTASTHVAAPGQGIYSTWAGSSTDYNSISGTSMATPVVSGAVALLAGAKPDATAAQIRCASSEEGRGRRQAAEAHRLPARKPVGRGGHASPPPACPALARPPQERDPELSGQVPAVGLPGRQRRPPERGARAADAAGPGAGAAAGAALL